nr:serine/threonine-protein kinase [Acidobacteriota bacterium]
MTTERWQQIKEIFHAALEHEAGERVAFLVEACAGDKSLRSEIESLIAAHEKDGSFIDSPAYEVAAQILTDDPDGSRAGQRLGSYLILSMLGRGGMGEIYLAKDERLRRQVALKLLPTQFTKDADRLRRFEQEARAASALNHPNIITIHEIGEIDSLHFIATEFVEGETLRERLSPTRLDLVETLRIVIQVGDALAAAHSAGIIHRDIKPDNIMLRPDGYVKVLDFGLAKLVEQRSLASNSESPTRRQVNTSPGMVMGTASYMSPEQARGEEVDARTDIWSLGVVLYEMLSGRVPFEGTTISHVIVNILEKEPAWPVQSSREAPAELDWIVKKALRKDREERYQTARELLGDLRSLKQRLQFESELERTTPKEDNSSNATGRNREATGFLQGGAEQTEQIRAARSTASFKNLLSPIGWNNRGAVLMLVAILLTIGGAVGAYKFFTRPVATRLETKPEAAATSLIKKTTQVTFSQGLDRFPALSPDGNSIAYSSDQNGNSEVYIKQLTSGGREIQLTTNEQQNFEPAWSPDGQRIAYY